MQTGTNAKRKRRLDALSQLHQSSSRSAAASQPQQRQHLQRPRGKAGTGSSVLPTGAPAGGVAPSSSVHSQHAAPPDDLEQGPAQFPYKPMTDALCAGHISARLQLPAATACTGNLEDALEALMVPHMPLPVAQSMIASRTAADKAVVLVNPTGRVNLARPSASSRGQRQLLANKLMPRAQRAQLSALPKSGIDHGPMLSLHDLWCKYTSGVLSNGTPENFERLLQTIDWHGALLRVASSSNPIYQHRAGIVAKVTHNTFVLVSDDGHSSRVPLKGSTFECSLDCGRVVQVVLTGPNSKSLKATEKMGTA